MTEQDLGINSINISIESAKEGWLNAKTYATRVHNEYVLEMQRCYYWAKKGYRLINLYDVLRQAGKNSDGDPKLAIAPANTKECFFHKERDRHDFYAPDNAWRSNFGRQSYYKKNDIPIPETIFRPWQLNEQKDIVRAILKTAPPTVPADCLPYRHLKNYHILWEVEKWELVPPRKDPLLLKRLGKATYAILKTWNPTPLEQAVAEGRTFNH